MNPHSSSQDSRDSVAENCNSTSKWAGLVDDQTVYAPTRVVKARVLKEQCSIPEQHVLVRDYGSAHDVALEDDVSVDLAEGNVFMTVPRCDLPQPGSCTGAPKLAWFIDDEPEITLRSNQTGRTLRDLFGLSVAVRLFRDLQGTPVDTAIPPDDAVCFADGPVFYTRRHHEGLSIVVNKQTFTEADGVKCEMTGREIASLITTQEAEVVRLKDGQEIPVGLSETVHLRGCEEFQVTRCNVKGGFEPARVERELHHIRENGAIAELIDRPIPAVIYRGVPTKKGYPHLSSTDVLVAIPAAYPGAMLDGAYLPAGSPLIGRVLGAQQGQISADGKTWILISYHPHNGGGAPPWNPTRHGIHSYYSEVLAWIQKAAH